MTNDYYSNLTNNKDNKKKYTKTFDLSQIAEDPMDLYLESIGLWKKRIARDGSCLFRAVAEQIYPCQTYHSKVRDECVEYMSKNRQDYEKLVSNIQFDQYLSSMRDHLEYGGQLEIHAMSKLYKRDFIIYQQPNNHGINVTQNEFSEKIFLCYSFNNHFDAIFTKEYRDHLALMQSLVYEILYDKVYGSAEQVDVARCLLRKSDTIYPKEFMNTKDNDNLMDEYEDLILNNTDENNNNYDEGEDIGEISKNKDDEYESIKNDKYIGQKMPLPYKVAKSLDPVIYRNTAFDAWLAAKKDDLNQKMITMMPGDKCLVRMNNEYRGNWMIGIIQSINNNLTTVHLPELRQNHCVTLDNIKPFNSEIMPNINYIHNVQKHVSPINSQFALIFSNSINRKPKKKQLQLKKSSSCHAISTGLETLPEENEDEEYMHHYYASNIYMNEYGAPLVHSQSLYTGFNTDKFCINQNNKMMHQSNKNRRLKYNNQNKLWSNQSFQSSNLIGSFHNSQIPNEALGTPLFTPATPIYNSTGAISTAPITQQGFQNPHYQPYMMTPACESYFYSNMQNTAVIDSSKSMDPHQFELKRHGSYESCLNKVQQNQTNINTYQQVPQHPLNASHSHTPAHLSSNQSDMNSYLLMPAPAVPSTSLAPAQQPTFAPPHNSGGMQRSFSCHAGIAGSSYEPNPPNSSGAVYLDYYMPHHQNNSSVYTTAAAATPMIVAQNQPVLLNGNNSSNVTTATPYSHNCMDNHLGYDLQFPRLENNQNLVPLNNNSVLEDNLNDSNRLSSQNLLWSKDKIGKNDNVFTETVYSNSASSNLNTQQYCYPYVIINIDGPVNYNAAYSHADDGSDLNLADINTLRFFFNLGIEHYRLCQTGNSYNPSSYSNNYIPTNMNQPLMSNHGHHLSGGPISETAIPNQSNSISNMSSNSIKANSSTPSNSTAQDIEKMSLKNQAVLVDNNNNIISNQLVPNMNGKSSFVNQTHNNQSRRQISQ